MVDEGGDLEFPACCDHCPYRKPVTASCTHAFRQDLIRSIDTDATCPVYSATKTEAMRALSESL